MPCFRFFNERFMMNEKKLNLMWSISLLVISIANIAMTVTRIFDAEMPDAVAILMCIVILAAVCVLVYTSLKKWQKKL